MIVPRFTPERCLILTDADVESLLACAMASEQQTLNSDQPSVLIPTWWGAQPDNDLDLIISAVEPAITRQARLYALVTDLDNAAYPPEDEPLTELATRRLHTRLLTEAAYLALESGIKRVVWPVRIPLNHPSRIKAIGDTLDRAMLVSRAVSLDATHQTAPEVVIETPFIDLSDAQLVDLARDLTLPIDACWWSDAQTLPLAQQRRAHWESISSRSAAQLAPKPGVQTHA